MLAHTKYIKHTIQRNTLTQIERVYFILFFICNVTNLNVNVNYTRSIASRIIYATHPSQRRSYIISPHTIDSFVCRQTHTLIHTIIIVIFLVCLDMLNGIVRGYVNVNV